MALTLQNFRGEAPVVCLAQPAGLGNYEEEPRAEGPAVCSDPQMVGPLALVLIC